MADLAQFMLDMSKNPALQQQFKSDPYATMSAVGLPDQDIAAVLSKNPLTIQKAVGASIGANKLGGTASEASDITVVIVVT
jgi:hypothetical protein